MENSGQGEVLQGEEQRLADMRPVGPGTFGHCWGEAGSRAGLPGDRPAFKCSPPGRAASPWAWAPPRP